MPCPQLPGPRPNIALCTPQQDSLQAPPKPPSSPCPHIVHAPQWVLRSRLHSPQEILLVPLDHAPSFSQGSTLAPPPPHPRLPLGTQFHPVPSCRLLSLPAPSLRPSLYPAHHAPAMQMQVNWPMRSRHVAWLRQGPDRHSLTSDSQRGPV